MRKYKVLKHTHSYSQRNMTSVVIVVLHLHSNYANKKNLSLGKVAACNY